MTYSQGTGLPGGNASRTIEAWIKTTTTSFPFTIAEYGSGGGVGTDFAFQVNDPHTL
ncbi:MAG: hypothetical protein JOZ41_11960, partial [Chloroflexi bacterium]|nr:hypothetical protein [Chloroflexota bacterium]